MPELIHETVITTVSSAGMVHVAPMGVRYADDTVVLMPFRPSTTLANIEASGRAVLNLITDVRVFAGCVTGRRQWPTVALAALPGDTTAGAAAHADQRLACALGHEQLRLVAHSQDAQRPVLRLKRAAAAQHAYFPGMNRAQAAVVEGAVLVSRLFMLPREKLEAEWLWLQIAIDKTAGPAELEAWGWLDAALRAHLAGLDAPPAEHTATTTPPRA
ncbi:MAG: hypothetical protein RLZZ584_515 [Pseudomonadota bacterium]